MKLKDVLIVYTHPAYGEYKSTLEIAKYILKKYGITYKLADRDKLKKEQFLGKGMVIAIGGDGTFLRAAQFIKKQLLFGVNADIHNKEGFYMNSSKRDFEAKLKKIMKNEFEIKKLPRLEARINSKKIGALALNEFFIGPKKAYHAAKYIVEINGRKERQKSSGILVTTPSGSYAWAKACHGRTLPLKSKKYQFVVREPYEGKVFKNYGVKYKILGKNQKVKINSEMLDGVIVADSVGKEYSFKNGSTATIGLSGQCLMAVQTE